MPKIAIVLTRGFADWEYALIAGAGGPFYGLDIRFFAPDKGETRSQGGLTAVVTRGLSEISAWRPEALVIVGGTIWETDAAPDIGTLIQNAHQEGTAIAGICGGTLAMARAGLLNTVRHTSNEASFLTQNADAYAGADYYCESAAAISNDGVITAPGTAPVSFAAAVFEAVGLDTETVTQFKAMLAAEHASG